MTKNELLTISWKLKKEGTFHLMSLRFDILSVALSVQGTNFVIQTFGEHEVCHFHILYNTELGHSPAPPPSPVRKIVLNCTTSSPRIPRNHCMMGHNV